MALLEVHHLSTAYGAIKALRGVSFSLDAGQVVTLIGANGAGKSTTLNTLSGLLKPTGGQIMFKGNDITSQRPDRIAASGLVQVPEGRRIIANMNVLENLTVGSHLRRDRRAKQELERIFALFPRLKERTHQKAGLLSGGEQQMLVLGRALMMQPDLLMLDEPSMGLAPLLVQEVFRIIAEIKRTGIPILLVEQNARQALAIADYAYVLERGEIVQSGPAADLRRDPAILSAYLG
ncbi:MAG: ABC transporter ATP-binding protein [Anaerolineae bacterium]|jgi:branched-chain amino acid transport system ATP-binding protein|nr:ABC transporter ATP-binding protein [Anaerolineae bacterium]